MKFFLDLLWWFILFWVIALALAFIIPRIL